MEKPKDNSKKNMMMGAAAGVAVGAVGGMVLAHALGKFILSLNIVTELTFKQMMTTSIVGTMEIMAEDIRRWVGLCRTRRLLGVQ